MKRALISSAVGVGGTGAGLTGCYAMGVFDGSADTNLSPINASVEEYKGWGLQEDALSFKNQDAPGCVKNTFSGIKKIAEAPGYKVSNATDTKASFTFDNSKDSDGCVAIDWSRTGNEGSKYTGEVTFMWAFKQGNQGFISYVNLEFEKYGNEKAVVEMLVYALSESGTSDKKWTITSQYELNAGDSAEINKDKLPKPGSALKELNSKNKNFWGMEMKDEDTSHLVEKNSLEDGKKKKYQGGSYWKWEGNKGSVKLNDWSSNLIDWWKEVFKNSNNRDLPSQLENFTGSWTVKASRHGVEQSEDDDS